MARFGLYQETHCGVCRGRVLLTSAVGSHALLEEVDGEKLPHVCPEEARHQWIAMAQVHRLAFRLVLDSSSGDRPA
jgi:hypothetical protein